MSDGFKSDYFESLYDFEDGNFWFRVRNRIIVWAMQRYGVEDGEYLEIGCGTGYVSSAISTSFPRLKLTGSEYFEEGLAFTRQRLPDADLIQLDAREMDFSDRFDVVGMFDVLEHIDADVTVLRRINTALRDDGLLVLTVPQHRWLWSVADECACHQRRYTSSELHQKVSDAGFEILKSSSFVTTLLPAMLLSRLLSRNKDEADFDAKSELKIHPVLNKVFEFLMGIDLMLMRIGIDLPVGGSRLLVAKKVDT